MTTTTRLRIPGSGHRAASQATAIHPRRGGESEGQRAHRSASKGGAISSAAEYDKPVRRWRLCAVHHLRTAWGSGVGSNNNATDLWEGH